MSNPFPEEDMQLQSPSRYPPAPAHELFDLSTTVDPSYVISLIRRLLPSDGKDGEEKALGDGFVVEECKGDGRKENSICDVGAEAMESIGNCDEANDQERKSVTSSVEETWNECGCILWDLAASEDHARFMVENFLLEVLLANLAVSESSRVTEISLGIIGNLACHDTERKKIASTNGLARAIVDQLLLDDVPCLCEAFRYDVLDLILRALEALSVIEDFSREVCHNKELLQLLKELIELPDKFEVPNSCVTASVLIANILTEATDLAVDLSRDLNFLQGLFEVFSYTSDDRDAKRAIWSTIARLLNLVRESEMGPVNLRTLASVIASKIDVIEDDLISHPLDPEASYTCINTIDSRVIAVKRISEIVMSWKSLGMDVKGNILEDGHCIDEEDVEKLLILCEKAVGKGA